MVVLTELGPRYTQLPSRSVECLSMVVLKGWWLSMFGGGQTLCILFTCMQRTWNSLEQRCKAHCAQSGPNCDVAVA